MTIALAATRTAAMRGHFTSHARCHPTYFKLTGDRAQPVGPGCLFGRGARYHAHTPWRARADMHALPLGAEQYEELDGLRPGAVEPVRCRVSNSAASPARSTKVVLAEHQPQLAAQDVQPLIALMHLQVRLAPGPDSWE
jgi:hypothetical protein